MDLLNNENRASDQTPRRCGAALLMCLFVIMFVTVALVNVLDNETIQQTATRNVIDYERALYLAGAGVHHAMAELEDDATWRGTVTDGAYPADNTYFATAVDGGAETVVITATGVAGGVSRSLEVTVSLAN